MAPVARVSICRVLCTQYRPVGHSDDAAVVAGDSDEPARHDCGRRIAGFLQDEERDDEQSDNVDDLDHRVDGGTRGVLVRVADRIAGDGRGVSV